MPPPKVPIVWYLDSEDIGPTFDRPNLLDQLRAAVDEFNKGDQTLDELDAIFQEIIGPTYRPKA